MYHAHRKYTDPTPQVAQYPMHEPFVSQSDSSQHQLDVDLDVYSQGYSQDYDLEDEVRQPTLSFVTTSTVDSTTSSPSISDAYTYGTERFEGKPEHEPRIRVRTNMGRENAYSSAESSMASAGYSFHAYSDNTFHPHPPPMPVPHPVGYNRTSTAEDSSLTSCQAVSPGSSYDHTQQSWRSPPMVSRERSNSASTTESTDTSESAADDRLSVGFAHSFSYLSHSFPARQPWDDEPQQLVSEANAVAMIDDGRSAILDHDRLDAMGGLGALCLMNESDLLRLPRFTHLLLPSIGPQLLQILPALLDVLSTTLVVLDISNNDLTAIPTGIRHCTALEELNVSGNPLRQLPSVIGDCVNLRMLIADNCMLQSLPAEMAQLNSLHTICIRSNRLVVIPSWLCLLTHLESLRVDNNPFASQWAPIVAPILASTLSQQTPTHSRSASQQSSSLRSMIGASGMASLRTPSSYGGSTSPSPAPSFPSSDFSQPTHVQGSNPRLQPVSAPRGPMEISSPISSSIMTTLNGPVLIGNKRPDGSHPGSMRAPSRAVTGPPPVSEVLSAGDRFSTASNRRAQSSMGHYATDESDAENSDAKPKWGFLRKMSMSRLRNDKDNKIEKLQVSAAANVKTMPMMQHQHSLPAPAFPTRPQLPPAARSASLVPTFNNLHMDDGQSRLSVASAMPMPIATGAMPVPPANAYGTSPGGARGKRRSFLPIDPSPPSLNVAIPSLSPLMAPQATLGGDPAEPRFTEADDTMETLGDESDAGPAGYRRKSSRQMSVSNYSIADNDGRYARGLESIKSYLRDLYDLSLPALEPYGGFEVIDAVGDSSSGTEGQSRASVAGSGRHPAIEGNALSRGVSMASSGSERETRFPSVHEQGNADTPSKRFKDDKAKRARVVREIYETEKTYVRGLSELVSIYVKPASMAVSSSKNETIIPVAERKVVFGGVESVLVIHRDNFLPALEKVVRPLLDNGDDPEGALSARTAHQVGEVFRTYIAYMKQYSTYINNFDNALARMRAWTTATAGAGGPVTKASAAAAAKSGAVGVAAVGASLVGSAVLPVGDGVPHSGSHLTPAQKKRVKTFLKRAKESPKHSQINLESYLLLPVQRVPRYKLLLEDLAMCTPPRESLGPTDALDDAINEISNLASLMNEEKREAESRLRLLHWQQRITSRGPSPLVQPHRKLVLDGALALVRVVKKASSYVEVDTPSIKVNADGDSTITGSKAVIPIEYINAEPMEKPIMLILCSDMLVLVQKRTGEGWDGQVDLFSVLRMATLREPASVSSSNDRILRVVDNKSIYYFNGGSHSSTLQWCRAINQQNRR